MEASACSSSIRHYATIDARCLKDRDDRAPLRACVAGVWLRTLQRRRLHRELQGQFLYAGLNLVRSGSTSVKGCEEDGARVLLRLARRRGFGHSVPHPRSDAARIFQPALQLELNQ